MKNTLVTKLFFAQKGPSTNNTEYFYNRYISTPPALPSSYVQRATLTLNKHGVNPPLIQELRSPGYPKTPEESFWNEFIADRPFMFGLFDTETYTLLMANMYSQPTYPDF